MASRFSHVHISTVATVCTSLLTTPARRRVVGKTNDLPRSIYKMRKPTLTSSRRRNDVDIIAPLFDSGSKIEHYLPHYLGLQRKRRCWERSRTMAMGSFHRGIGIHGQALVPSHKPSSITALECAIRTYRYARPSEPIRSKPLHVEGNQRKTMNYLLSCTRLDDKTHRNPD